MKKISFISFILLLFTACEKDANIDIQEMDPVPVIEGVFSNFASDSYFKVTMSKGFERHSYEYEPVTDAQLSVTDSHGNVINFVPDSQGVYRTTENGIPGEIYKLQLNKGNNKLTADSTMPFGIELTDFDFVLEQQANDNYNSKLILYFDDSEQQTDYYFVKLYYRYSSSSTFNNQVSVYFSDADYNRQEHSLVLSYIPFSGTGDYKIKLFHLNKAYIDYLNTLDALGDMNYGESPFQIFVPGNPETNVQGGIGYFATMASDSLVKHFN